MSAFPSLDRHRFLELVVSIGALAACGGRGAEVPSAEVHIPTQPAPPRPVEPAVTASAAPSSAPTAERGAPTEEGDAEDGEVYATCGEVDARQVKRPAGACSDATGAPGACISCKGFAFPGEQCASYKKLLKPKVAEAAVACLRALPAKQQCDACAVYACGDRAMKGSCPDPSADAECRALRTRCPNMALDECGRYVSALLPAGRAKLRACMQSCSLYSCVEGL